MGRIDLNNYEAYLLDYLEGHLNEDLSHELQVFALSRPELEIDLEVNELPTIEKEEIHFDRKDRLKKELDMVSEQLIDYLEKNLSKNKREEVEFKLLNNRQLASDLALLKQTILVANVQDSFLNKEQLRKTEDDLILNNRLLSYFEDQLNLQSRLEIEEELKMHASVREELALISKTRLVADPFVTYTHKAELKRSGRIIPLFARRSLSAVAAAILVLFVFSLIFHQFTKRETLPKPVLANAKINTPHPDNRSGSEKESDKHSSTLIASLQRPLVSAHQVPKQVQARKEQSLPVHQQEINSGAGQEQGQTKPTEAPTPELDNSFVGSQPSYQNQFHEKEDSSALVQNSHRQTWLTVEEDTEEEAFVPAQEKYGFWKRAVSMARQANKLGIKAVDGAETNNHKFALSFNSFSVEKR